MNDVKFWEGDRSVNSYRMIGGGYRQAMRALKHTMWDEISINPEGQTVLKFVPHPYGFDSNGKFCNKNHQLIAPEEFFAFGLVLHTYSLHKQVNAEVIRNMDALERARELLFESAVLEMIVGCLPYVRVPITHIFGSEYVLPTYNHQSLAFPSTGTRYDGTTYDAHEHIGIMFDKFPNYYDLTIERGHQTIPLHISPNQDYRIEIRWADKIKYDVAVLGQVRLRIGLVGLFLQCSA